METRISATELVRRLGDVLGRIRYRGESFVVDRNGAPVARIGPVAGAPRGTLADALAAWGVDPADPGFANDLARVNAADRPPADPWAS
jgi:antitoxin (DNA-binding transcriptional repressor) of toxin-antitoxin stability system